MQAIANFCFPCDDDDDAFSEPNSRQEIPLQRRCTLLLDLCEDLGVSKELVLLENADGEVESESAHSSLGWEQTHLLANLDRTTAPAREKHTITSLHAGRDDVTVLVRRARTDSDDGSLREGLVRRRGRKVDAACGFLPLADV